MLKTIRHLYPSLTALAALSAVMLFLGGCHHHSVDDSLAAGDSAMQTNQLGEAESDYNEAIKAAPNDPRTHIALGNLYIFEHKTAQAQAEFMKVLDLDPKNAATHVALGNLYMDQSQYPLAENQYRAAVALEPERPAYHLDLSQALIKQNKIDAAEDQIRTALGLDPKNAQAHYALANLLNTIPNRQAEAQTEYEQAHALDPKLSGPAAEGASTPEAEASVVTPAPAAPTPEAAATNYPQLGTGPSPAAAPLPPMPAIPTTAAVPPRIKPLNKLFLLTKNSPVYQNPDNASAVVAQVRANKYVHVTGIAGNYLQVRLRTGTIGFIPISAAE